MKVVILAGGFGTRLSEVTEVIPKPMVEIGGRPILWHVMKHYTHYGFNEFVIALGYKGNDIKRYFLEYETLSGSLRVDLRDGSVRQDRSTHEDWILHLKETGLETGTGGRILALEDELKDGTFCLTYGDGVCNVDIPALVAFHKEQGALATVTAVRPPSRFGGLELDGPLVREFSEKPQVGEGWINGGFMVCEPGIIDYLDGPEDSFERVALERAAEEGRLAAFRHDHFWQCMDTLRDVRTLEALWQAGKADWKVWGDS